MQNPIQQRLDLIQKEFHSSYLSEKMLKYSRFLELFLLAFTVLSLIILIIYIFLSSFDLYGFGIKWIKTALFVALSTNFIVGYFEQRKIRPLNRHVQKLTDFSENVLRVYEVQFQKLNQELFIILRRKMMYIRLFSALMVFFALYCAAFEDEHLWNLGKILAPIIWFLVISLYTLELKKINKNLIAFERFAN